MRLRLRFTKYGKVRWTSHRDVARMWERAFRRVELPLAYSVGFSPRPRISFGLALSTGHESDGEYLDADLDSAAFGPGGSAPPLDLTGLASSLGRALPDGLDVTAGVLVEDRAASLQIEVTSCGWVVGAVGASPDELRVAVARAMAADTLVITRQRKGADVTDDVRPAILAAAVEDRHDAGPRVVCELATQPRGLRPSELLLALDPSLEEGLVRRTHQWIYRDGARREPIPLDATGPAGAPPWCEGPPAGASHAPTLERAS